jgi:hypothetical protein
LDLWVGNSARGRRSRSENGPAVMQSVPCSTPVGESVADAGCWHVDCGAPEDRPSRQSREARGTSDVRISDRGPGQLLEGQEETGQICEIRLSKPRGSVTSVNCRLAAERTQSPLFHCYHPSIASVNQSDQQRLETSLGSCCQPAMLSVLETGQRGRMIRLGTTLFQCLFQARGSD